MRTSRLEAFTDGVIAILITIMVLNLQAPKGTSFSSLSSVAPVALAYVLSFINMATYWQTHHHMFQLVDRVTGPILMANLHFIFWLSLIPFTTVWVGERGFAAVPVTVYGIVQLVVASAGYGLARVIVASRDDDVLTDLIGSDIKGKLSLVIYIIGIGLSFVDRWVAFGLYILVALSWVVPDRGTEARIEAELARARRANEATDSPDG